MTTSTDQMRTAEVIASLCLATDLGMGFPFEHGLHATATTMRLCDALDVDHDTRVRTFYASLLMYAGCTVDAGDRARIFGGSMTRQHTHRQFGSRLESLTGVARALPSPDSSLPGRVFEILEHTGRGKGGEIQLTDAIAELLQETTLIAHRFKGTRYDCGSKFGYLQATVALGLEHPEVGDRFRAFLEGKAKELLG